MKRYLIIHYSEIALKKGNTGYFLEKLKKHIKAQLQRNFLIGVNVKSYLGRIVIPLDDFNEAKYSEVLKKIPGIKNFHFVYEGSPEIEKVGMEILANMPNELKEVNNFCVRVQRSQKAPYSSVEAEREIGGVLIGNGFNKKVKLENPELEINIEVFDKHGYFSYKKYPGAGGLPANSGNKLVCLISGGIDSPVAAYRMMKRGARVIFVHFHAYPYTDKEEQEHVVDLVKILSVYQFHTKLYMVPFGDIQKKIATNVDVPAKYRVVLYRRMMIRIAEAISKKNLSRGLVTGDSFGQVASQTAENMFTIHEASKIPLYQPLVAYDKEEIITISKEIGTYEISKLPCKDTCSMFSPQHPVLTAKVKDLQEMEKLLDINGFVRDAVKGMEVTIY